MDPEIEKMRAPSIARTVDPPYPPGRTRRPPSAGTIDRSFDHWPHRRTAQAEKTESDSGIPPLAALGTRLTLRLAPTAPRPSHPPPPPPQPAPTAAPDTAAVFSCVPLDADTRPRAIASWVHCAPNRTTRSRPHAALRPGRARTPTARHGPPIGALRPAQARHDGVRHRPFRLGDTRKGSQGLNPHGTGSRSRRLQKPRLNQCFNEADPVRD